MDKAAQAFLLAHSGSHLAEGCMEVLYFLLIFGGFLFAAGGVVELWKYSRERAFRRR